VNYAWVKKVFSLKVSILMNSLLAALLYFIRVEGTRYIEEMARIGCGGHSHN
jgi:hypothetical protein